MIKFELKLGGSFIPQDEGILRKIADATGCNITAITGYPTYLTWNWETRKNLEQEIREKIAEALKGTSVTLVQLLAVPKSA